MQRYQFKIKDLDCAMCAKKIEDKLNAESWVEQAVINFNTEKIVVTTERTDDMLNDVLKIAHSVEPECSVSPFEQTGNSVGNKKFSWFYPVFVLGFAIGLAGVLIDHFAQNLNTVAYALMWVGGGLMLTKTLYRAFLKILRSHSVDENLLVSISVIGALAIGEGMEGLMVIVLYQIGKYFEQKAVQKTRNSVQSLILVKPETVSVKIGDEWVEKAIRDVEQGSTILVKAGEIVPLDGVITDGKCTIDVSSLTGESVPVDVAVNDSVMSGSVNLDGVIQLVTIGTDQDSTITKILALLETASNRKTKSETIVSRVTKFYVPAVILCAIAVALGFGLSGHSVADSMYKGMMFLVVSCPCAVAISVPLSYFCGIGNASKHGILVKGTNFLDNASSITTIAFDKTGTITTGNFSVQEVKIADGYVHDELMRLAYFAERNSTHPIAKAIVQYVSPHAMEWVAENVQVSDFQEVAGKGVSYTLDGNAVFVGKSDEDSNEQYTTVHLAINGKIVATFYLADAVKREAKDAVDYFKRCGIKTEMLTGDNEAVAKRVADEVGIDSFRYGLMPSEKFAEMENLLANKAKATDMIAYAGDGINDAPVLGRADIGIAMGLCGSSASVDTADVVLMKDDLRQLVTLRKLSKRTRLIVAENVYATLAIKLLFVILGLVGVTGLAWAVFADVGLTCCTILNALRVLYYKERSKK